MDYLPGEDHTIEKPEEYSFWRDYVPRLTPAWPGKLLSWVGSEPKSVRPRTSAFSPEGEGLGLWVYRRIADPRNLAARAWATSKGMTVVNWPQNDYWLGNLVGVTPG